MRCSKTPKEPPNDIVVLQNVLILFWSVLYLQIVDFTHLLYFQTAKMKHNPILKIYNRASHALYVEHDYIRQIEWHIFGWICWFNILEGISIQYANNSDFSFLFHSHLLVNYSVRLQAFTSRIDDKRFTAIVFAWNK